MRTMVQVRFARVVPCCRHPRLPRTRLVLAPLQVPHTPTPSLWCSRLSPVCVLLAPHEWQLACPAGVLSVLQVSLWCVFTHVLSACTVCTPCASNAVPLRGPPPSYLCPPPSLYPTRPHPSARSSPRLSPPRLADFRSPCRPPGKGVEEVVATHIRCLRCR